MNKSTLEVKNLSKSYRDRQIVKDVSLSVKGGEVVGLLGPNGAGKTTCFYMIAGIIPPDSGHILLNEETIDQLPMHARSHKGLGYLPQEASVFRKLTVRENILSILELRHELSETDRHTLCDNLLNEFHLNTVTNSLGLSLSGGERRRVEIARALAANPKFILLDEPFAGVDPISVIDIKNQIHHLASRGIGILITDHNVRETLDICDKAYILNNGSIIALGQPHEILAHEEVRAVYLGESFQL